MSQAGQNLLLTSVTSYFDKKHDYKKCLYDIVNGKSALSLRVIDWFVTHYTKENNTIYWVDDQKGRLFEIFPVTGGNSLRKVHLYLDYRAQLKSYTKLNFDPFRRHNRISFLIDTQKQTLLETTVGQLNFFRWCFQNHILEYICNHLGEIERHMAHSIQQGKTDVPSTVATATKKGKQALQHQAGTDIITAPCCLHFS
jgi:hypothetical protein